MISVALQRDNLGPFIQHKAALFGSLVAQGLSLGVRHSTIAPRMIARPQPAQRMTSLMLVLLLHALLLMLLLNAFTQKNARPDAARETILRLLPMFQRAQEAAPRSGTVTGTRAVIAPSAPPVIPAQPAPDISGLGMQLFGCAPERLATLSPTERARCATGLVHPDRSIVTIPKSHVVDPARRAAEMKARNSPIRIPCTYVGVVPGPYFSNSPTGMIDPSCALDGLVNGFAPVTGLPK